MSLISNLIARLSLDSSQFDAGAARARKSLYGLTAESAAANKAIAGIAVGLAKFGAVAATVYAAGRAVKGVVSAAMENERAERQLSAALEVTGQARQGTLPAMVEQAKQLESLTVHNRNAILQSQAFALTMGATAGEVQKMTEAAIGLASAYGRDLNSAMRLIALARQGETGQLKEMGIVLDKTAGRHQQYLQLLDIGSRNFQRAQQDAQTLAGSIEQLGNQWQQLKAEVAKPLVPPLLEATKAINETIQAVKEAKDLEIKFEIPKSDRARILREARQEYVTQMQGRDDAFATREISPLNQQLWDQIYNRRELEYRQDRMRREMAADQVAQAMKPQIPVGPLIKEVPEEIRRLNESLKQKVEAQRLSAEGDDYAAERAKFAAEAYRQYGKGTDDALAAITKYNSGLEKLAETRRQIEIDQYKGQLQARNEELKLTIGEQVRGMEQENRILKLLAAGRQEEARTLRIVNDLKAAGLEFNESGANEQEARTIKIVNELKAKRIELTQDEIKTLNDMVKANGDLAQQEVDRIVNLIDEQERLAAAVERRMDMQRQWMDVLRQGIDGFGDATARAIVMGEKFDVLLQKLAQDIAYMVVRNQVANMISGGLNFAFPGLNLGIRHGGGTVGSGMEPTRTMPASVLIGAPRLHAGLGSDEFPAILQTGEKVSSRSEVGRDARMMGRMVALLERIAEKPSTNVAVVRSREEIYDALRHRDGHRVIAEINARNG